MSTDKARRWRLNRELLRHRDFRFQFAAQATSMTGSLLSPVALALGVLTVTDDVLALGLVLGAYTVPLVLFVLVGGVWADRLPRHRVMLAADLVRAVVQTAVGVLFIGGHPQIWQLMALQAISGTATAFYHPASTGLTAVTVPTRLLQPANALLAMTRSVAGSVGPMVAGVLVVTVGPGWAFVIDGLSFVGSALLLLQIRIPPRTRDAAAEPFTQELRKGFQDVVRRSWVWSSVAAFAVANFVMAALLVLGPALTLKEGGAIEWAVIVAVLNVGQVLGNLLALLHEPKRPILAGRVVELTQILLLLALAFHAPLWVTVAAAVVSGIGVTFPDALWYTALQRYLPEQTISRVASYDWLGSLALRPVAFSAAGAAGARFGMREVLAWGAAALVVSRIVGMLPRQVRELGTDAGGTAAAEPDD